MAKTIKKIMKRIYYKLFRWLSFFLMLGVYVIFAMGVVCFFKWAWFKIC